MAGHQLDLELSKADSVVPKQEQKLEQKPEKCDPIGLRLCDATDLAEYMLHPSTGVIGAFG